MDPHHHAMNWRCRGYPHHAKRSDPALIKKAMANPRDVAVFVGSLRKEAFSRKAAKAFIELAPPTIKGEIVEIGQLAPYNQDLDSNMPAEWLTLKQRIRAADGVLFVTPEYNRSVPGALKNAIDIASRPYGDSAWNGKPAAVISVTPGHLGAFGANHHLRQSLLAVNMPAMPQPEAYISNASNLFDAQGRLSNDSTREFLRKFAQAFSAWMEIHAKSAGA